MAVCTAIATVFSLSREVDPAALLEANPEFWQRIDRSDPTGTAVYANDGMHIIIYPMTFVYICVPDSIDQIDQIMSMLVRVSGASEADYEEIDSYTFSARFEAGFCVDLDHINAAHTGAEHAQIVYLSTSFTVYATGETVFVGHTPDRNIDQALDEATAFIRPVLRAARVITV